MDEFLPIVAVLWNIGHIDLNVVQKKKKKDRNLNFNFLLSNIPFKL